MTASLGPGWFARGSGREHGDGEAVSAGTERGREHGTGRGCERRDGAAGGRSCVKGREPPAGLHLAVEGGGGVKSPV